jgi:hypothetical protein
LPCEGFFGRHLAFEEFKKIAALKFDDLFVRNNPKSNANLNAEFCLNLNLVCYMRLLYMKRCNTTFFRKKGICNQGGGIHGGALRAEHGTISG